MELAPSGECVSWCELMNTFPDVDAVLLDVDGTLIDSNAAHADAWAQALREHGVTVTGAQVRPLIGMGGDKLLPAIAGIDHESAQGKALSERKQAIFATRLPALRPTRGARPFVEWLRHQSIQIVIATSAGEHEMHALLEQAGVADLIPRRTSKDDADESKPDPDIVHAALTKAGTAPQRTVMIGDTPYDIEAARRAGIGCIALRSGGHWRDADLAAAIAIYDDPAALLAASGTPGGSR